MRTCFEKEKSFIFKFDCTQKLIDLLKIENLEFELKYFHKPILEIYLNTSEYFKEKLVVSKTGNIFNAKYKTKTLLMNQAIMSYKQTISDNWEHLVFGGISVNCIVPKIKTQYIIEGGKYSLSFNIIIPYENRNETLYYVEIESNKQDENEEIFIKVSDILKNLNGKELTVLDSKIVKCRITTKFLNIMHYEELIELFNQIFCL